MKLLKIFGFIVLIIVIILFSLLNIFEGLYINDSNTVDIKVVSNRECEECTSLDSYLKVYKKAGVQFGNIDNIDYTSSKGKEYINEYRIQKLPFIIFSKNLDRYDTIANSWSDTFGYKNKKKEFIPTDIIPPYFNLDSQETEGLLNITYIGYNSCDECFLFTDIKKLLSSFGLKFKVLKDVDKSSDEAEKLIKKYNIEVLPSVILSKNTSLYKNFSYFWTNFGTIETDGNFVLRNPEKLGLKYLTISTNKK
ncbi:MAG: hypothetical protein PHV23_05085 [Candidatus Gracilibacteria bacterium]|nr:hypothetical protein [Candidatus Gracilibacteria bacterium]